MTNKSECCEKCKDWEFHTPNCPCHPPTKPMEEKIVPAIPGQNETHETKDGYCCACDYDITGFKAELSLALDQQRAEIKEEIKGLKLECDTVICDCGSPLKEWDIAKLVDKS